MAQGGCTVIDITLTGEVEEAWTGINGTQMNCSGGPMPWGTWITCEETVNGPDVGADFTNVSNVPLTQPHGYIFEVPTTGRSDAEPVTKAGRFAHESVAFDPRGGALYLSEDNFGFPSGFYRYTPQTSPMETGRLANDGRLQMLKVKGVDEAHLEAAQEKGARYHVEWVDIDDPDPTFPYTPGQPAPTTNDAALVYVGDQGRAQGAAHFSRLEGTIYDNGVVYFTSTQGGGAAMTGPNTVAGYGNGFGQVWGYDTRSETLFLVYQSPSRQVLDFPDNITTSRRGTLILCEDNTDDNYVRGLSRGGQLWDIALNRLAGRTDDEFAGSTFSPDGHTLFVNIQASRGMPVRDLGPVGAHRRLTGAGAGGDTPREPGGGVFPTGVGVPAQPGAERGRGRAHGGHEPGRRRRVDVGLGIGHGHPRHRVVVVVEHRHRDRTQTGGDEAVLDGVSSLAHGLELRAQLRRRRRAVAVPLDEGRPVGVEGTHLGGRERGEHRQTGCRERCRQPHAHVGDELRPAGRSLLDDVEHVPPVEHREVRVVARRVDEPVHDPARHPLQRRLALVGGPELVCREPEPVATLLGEVAHVAAVDEHPEQVVDARPREAEVARDGGRRHRLAPAGDEGEHVEGVSGGRGVGHGQPTQR